MTKVEVTDRDSQHFIMKSINDGARSAINLVTVNPKDLTTSKMFLKHKTHGTVASIFYMTGKSTHSSLTSWAGKYEVYSIHVQPLDVTWKVISNNLATAFNVSDVYVKTFWKGIEFRTAYARPPNDNSSSPTKGEGSASNFPVRAATKVYPRNGKTGFNINDVRNLPFVEDEIVDDSPVLVTFTVQLSEWKPQKKDRALCEKYDEGCDKTLIFWLQDVIILGEGESYDGLESLYDMGQEGAQVAHSY